MIRVAILGAAHPHVEYVLSEVAARPDFSLVGVAEADPEMRAKHLSGLSDIVVYGTPDELLAAQDIDVAFIAGVYSERAHAIISALTAGAHVIADKPLCTTLEDLARIERCVAQSGRHVSVIFEKRFYPATLAIRKMIDEGELGQLALVASTGPHKLNLPTRPPWFLRRATYGGIAGDLPVHDIDLALLLSGARSGTVSALTGKARNGEPAAFDDHVAVLLRAGNLAATIEANWLGPQSAEVHGRYRMRLTGTEGTAELDWAHHALTVETHRRPLRKIELPAARPPAAYFFDAVAAGIEPEITTAQSLLATRVALLAQASADAGGAQRTW